MEMMWTRAMSTLASYWQFGLLGWSLTVFMHVCFLKTYYYNYIQLLSEDLLKPLLLFQLSLRFLSSILTAAVANLWVFIPAVVIIALFLALRRYYLKTARDIKRLESIGMSTMLHYIIACTCAKYSTTNVFM